MNVKPLIKEELTPKYKNGMGIMLLGIALLIVSILLVVFGAMKLETEEYALGVPVFIVGVVWISLPGWLPFAGLKIIKPNEAIVLTFFGKYAGTLKEPGFYWVNPFMSSMRPANTQPLRQNAGVVAKISLKTMTLNNGNQKINDLLGNPIDIGIVVIWRVVNPTMAVFNVENYMEFLSIQCDSALRNIVREYPYDKALDGDDEKTLRGGTREIAERLRAEIQEKTHDAGLEIIEARITYLSYAPEIAAAMLQRQQASAIVDARQLIVEGAVGMVEMALAKLNENDVVRLDEERKAAMVSNLLVVLCGNRDAQPVVNSGSLY